MTVVRAGMGIVTATVRVAAATTAKVIAPLRRTQQLPRVLAQPIAVLPGITVPLGTTGMADARVATGLTATDPAIDPVATGAMIVGVGHQTVAGTVRAAMATATRIAAPR